MSYIKLFVAVFVFTVTSAITLSGQETKQGAVPPADAAKAPEEKQEVHSHGAGNVKRHVATVDQDGVQRIDITGGEYYFNPNYIVVKVNVPVELNVKKTGFVPHDIVIKAPEAGIDLTVSLDKKPEVIKFTPKATGKYEMYCSKKFIFAKSHKEKGMDGVLEVVP